MAKKTTKKRVHSGKGAGRSARKVVRRQQSKKKSSGATAGKSGSGGGAKAMIDGIMWSHGMLGALLNGWPSDRWTYQSAPTDGHALWQVGHLACVYDWFANLLDGQKGNVPEAYNAMFGYGSKPTPDASAYPNVDSVRGVHEGAWERLSKVLSKMKDEDLAKACAGDTHGLAKNKGEIVRMIAWHDGWHQGQVSNLRKALGLPGVM